jgi:hypothetical protein
MFRRKRAVMTAIVLVAAAGMAMTLPIASGRARAPGVSFAAGSISPASISTLTEAQSGCPLIFPDGPVTVAPNQPEVQDRSTVGIINALCDVTLDFIGCGFTPTSITLGCDTNGDGVSDLSIPLKNITVIQRPLLQATIPSSTSDPGTAFPLACCGGVTDITLTRTVGAGDDNIFGPFTQTLTCSIDLGIRAPVVISATPVEGDCAIGQNLLIPGSCFLLADGKPNVTSVFAVEAGNPNNVIQAGPIEILSANLIDAFFKPGPANAGKTFLIYASGPNGTSRNLTELPAGVPAGCPLGNEQGVKVTFKCKSSGGTDPADAPPPLPDVFACNLERGPTGAFSLVLTGRFQDGGSVTISGVAPKKVKLKEFDPGTNTFSKMILKGRLCENLPGNIIYVRPDAAAAQPFQCFDRCAN